MADASSPSRTARRMAWPTVAMLIAGALVALLAYGVLGKQTDTTLDDAVRSGKRPALPGAGLTLARLDGAGGSRIDALRGKVAVVNLWASWCGPCEVEAPVLQQVHEQLQSDGSGSVIGVTIRDFPDRSRHFERSHGITFPSLRDRDNALYRKLGSTGLPETFVLDRRGRIVAMSRGVVTREFLTAAVARAKASE